MDNIDILKNSILELEEKLKKYEDLPTTIID